MNTPTTDLPPSLPTAAADMMPPDDQAGPIAADQSGSEDCFPLAALAMPDGDQGDQMANPEVGDKVQAMVEGTVTRIEGDNVYVKREAVNGKPVDASDEEADPAENEDAEPAPDAEGAALRDDAAQAGPMS